MTNNGDPSNHVVAVEFDTIQSREFRDMDDNLVGIDINRLRSEKAASAGSILSSHYILGWTFKLNGKASDIDPSRLPKLPDDYQQDSRSSFKKILAISLSMTGLAVLIFLTISFMLLMKRKKLMEVLEDWEVQFGPHRFAYKDLYIATKGFKNSELLGKGGFGKVYKGTLLSSNLDIPVKKVSHDSGQGMREFIAEIATIGRLRHPNLVRLLGYCRRKGELYLVYDCMPKGSLDKFLYHQPEQSLDWSQRFKIIKDVASGLLYLHQQWVQVIIHRDIKPANILLDESMNAKLEVRTMKIFVLLLLLMLNKAVSQGERGEFGFNGYLYDSYGSANLDSNGLLKLTNYTEHETGQVFYNFPVRFKNSPNGTVSSFSTTFVFAIVSEIPTFSGHGIAFVISPTKGLPYSFPSQYLGLFNSTNNGDPSNHVVAVEFDTIQSIEFNDMDDNHVGIDTNSLISEKAASAGYYKEDGTFKNISLISRKPIQAWVEYDSSSKQLNITLHPLHVAKPKTPLL
ncbi:hypothetical protein F2Q70_00020759 [Brassica cretica]|uniref:non-specific serine/threonine protein kinase n=2 Tax=Brassica cretica TaxID=69181 RepID=A0A8S9GGY6_BRACR|nr:hypothetical protein F2Q70_00020759 [Brassica cretica]